MTDLKHSDALLKARAGQTVLVAEPVKGTNMRDGGQRDYTSGDLLRVKHCTAGLLWCLDDDGYTVTFDRVEMAALELCT